MGINIRLLLALMLLNLFMLHDLSLLVCLLVIPNVELINTSIHISANIINSRTECDALFIIKL